MSVHVPVLVDGVLQWLDPARGGVFVDCTVGLGGHARALLDAGATRVVGFDRDGEALAMAAETLAPFGSRVELIHADYRELGVELDRRGVAAVDGVVADLGVSSLQSTPGRAGSASAPMRRSTCGWIGARAPPRRNGYLM